MRVLGVGALTPKEYGAPQHTRVARARDAKYPPLTTQIPPLLGFSAALAPKVIHSLSARVSKEGSGRSSGLGFGGGTRRACAQRSTGDARRPQESLKPGEFRRARESPGESQRGEERAQEGPGQSLREQIGADLSIFE